MTKTLSLLDTPGSLEEQTGVDLNLVMQSVTLGRFTASKQSSLFKSLKEGHFSGKLIFGDSKKNNYVFFLYLGRVIYVTGGVHPVKRWQRYLQFHAPSVSIEAENFEQDWLTIEHDYRLISWEYAFLDFWFKQKKITREQFLRILKSYLAEILFDLSQARGVSYELDSHSLNLVPAIFLDVELSIAEVGKQSQTWNAAKLTEHSPDLSPRLKQSEFVDGLLEKNVYDLILPSFQAGKTIRDIAVESGQNFISLTHSLRVYKQRNIIDLEKIEDLIPPIDLHASTDASLFDSGYSIGCFSQDLDNIKVLKKMAAQAGYQFHAVQNELEAIELFLTLTPSFIFLDVKDFQLSSQLRKLTALRNVPLILLTEETGFSTVLKAKIAGFWDILTKPIQLHNFHSLLSRLIDKQPKCHRYS